MEKINKISKIKVVHYINNFFAGIGGEDRKSVV